jgi:endoglycosylceramidase
MWRQRRLSGQRRARLVAVALVFLSALIGLPTLPGAAAGGRAPAGAAAGPVGHDGRWLTDADGRVLLPHGVNLVSKEPGVTPEEMGFGEDDADWLAANGFEVVRLGTTAASLMPTPGVIDTDYVDSFERTVDLLTDHGLRVLVDLHQDGWGPTLGSDGFPEWMTLTHGAEDTGTPFPLYYVTNPAIQVAFDSFWANEAGPGGTPLQDHVATMFEALAQSLGDNDGVLGYDLLNEPWPGTVWDVCLNDPAGCPAQDQALDAYHARMTTAIRRHDPSRLIFGEPYVLFNFGQSATNVGLPGGDPASGLSYHLYALDEAAERQVQRFAVEWSERTGGALLNTEFGATKDPVAIDRQVNELDGALVPWIWWAYDEDIVRDLDEPPAEGNLHTEVIDTLVRPHASAVAGTPVSSSYAVADRVMRFTYSTARSDGGTFAPGTVTSFQTAPRTYPKGYRVKVTGGRVTSAANAAQLTVLADGGAAQVTVKLWPADQAEPPDPTVPTTVTTTSTTAPARPASPAKPIKARASFTG